MGEILNNIEIHYQQIQRKNPRMQGRSMIRREQAVRDIKLVEGGLLKMGQEGGIQSQAFGLEAVDALMAMAAEQASWGTNVVIEP